MSASPTMCGSRPARYRLAVAGFSLLEVLVALVVMAMSLGVLYRVVGNATHQVIVSDNTVHASLLAQSLLREYPQVPSGTWQQQGREGERFDWKVAGSPYPIRQDDLMHPLGKVMVELTWQDAGKTHHYILETLRPLKEKRL